jgi:hypothetical protein
MKTKKQTLYHYIYRFLNLQVKNKPWNGELIVPFLLQAATCDSAQTKLLPILALLEIGDLKERSGVDQNTQGFN